jgi:hypothetical protein
VCIIHNVRVILGAGSGADAPLAGGMPPAAVHLCVSYPLAGVHILFLRQHPLESIELAGASHCGGAGDR